MSADILLPDFFPHPVLAADRLLHTLDVKRSFLSGPYLISWQSLEFICYLCTSSPGATGFLSEALPVDYGAQ